MIQLYGSGTPLSQEGITIAGDSAGVGSAELWSIISVETSGFGFLPDRRPKILFERHVFTRLTGGRFDNYDPDISARTAGGYGPGGTHQYDRLDVAIQLDASAALESASWGLGQLMGENHHAAGFGDVESMVKAMVTSEDNQVLAMAKFLDSTQMTAPLKAHNWAALARRYNGPDYAAHNYDGLLQHFYERYSNGALPDLTIRSVQAYLTYCGYVVGTIDGVLGSKTHDAIVAFQAKAGSQPTGRIDAALLAKLSAQSLVIGRS
jgi:hypothetical protein